MLSDHLTHALGGSVGSQLSAPEVVNDAGRHLMSMHRWSFAQQPRTFPLRLVANQGWIDLPDDFGEFVGIADSTSYFQFTTLGHIAELEDIDSGITSGSFWCAIAGPEDEPNQAPSQPRRNRLVLFPTPESDDATAGSLRYRAGWVDLVDGSDVARVPWYAENLLKMLVRTFGLGYQEDSLEERLQRLESSSVFRRAASIDGRQQPTLGPIRNTASGASDVSLTDRYRQYDVNQL